MDPTEFQPDRPLPSDKRRLPYRPSIVAAEPIRVFKSEEHTAILLDKVQTAGIVQYKFLLIIFEKDPDDPSLIVSSELFAEGPDHAVGVFTKWGRHETLHPINQDWIDVDKFCGRALGIVRDRLGIELRETKRKKPWWKFW